jgi:4-hydroxythreonine-4-phosphate dehydrogenase
MLQSLCAVGGVLPPVRMMLANDELRVVLVTIHMALRGPSMRWTRRASSRPCASPMRRAALRHAGAAHRGGRPEPACGEGGCSAMRRSPDRAGHRRRAGGGHRRPGPFAPDTVFMRARHAPGTRGVRLRGGHDHDQGLIPVKYLGVEEGST